MNNSISELGFRSRKENSSLRAYIWAENELTVRAVGRVTERRFKGDVLIFTRKRILV